MICFVPLFFFIYIYMSENNDDYFLHENTSTNSLYSLEIDTEKQFLKDKVNSLEIEIKELKKEISYYKLFIPIGIILDVIGKYYDLHYSLDEICESLPNISKQLVKDIIINNKSYENSVKNAK